MLNAVKSLCHDLLLSFVLWELLRQLENNVGVFVEYFHTIKLIHAFNVTLCTLH